MATSRANKQTKKDERSKTKTESKGHSEWERGQSRKAIVLKTGRNCAMANGYEMNKFMFCLTHSILTPIPSSFPPFASCDDGVNWEEKKWNPTNSTTTTKDDNNNDDDDMATMTRRVTERETHTARKEDKTRERIGKPKCDNICSPWIVTIVVIDVHGYHGEVHNVACFLFHLIWLKVFAVTPIKPFGFRWNNTVKWRNRRIQTAAAPPPPTEAIATNTRKNLINFLS